MTDVLDNLTYDGSLIPVIVQDIATKTVLMFAYANKEAVTLTKETGFAHYYSRSRQKLWKNCAVRKAKQQNCILVDLII